MRAQRADARQRRAAIITAAQEIFRTVPEADITLHSIAKKAGVGIATLYRNFPTREDLNFACADDLLNRLDGLAQRTLQDFDEDPEAHWREFVWTIVNLGGGTLATVLAPGDLFSLPDPVASSRDAAITSVGKLLDKAAAAALIEASIEPLQFAAEMIVVTRPQRDSVYTLDRGVHQRLVERLLVAWKAMADS